MLAGVARGHHDLGDGADVVSGEVGGWGWWLNGWTGRGVTEKLRLVESSVPGLDPATRSDGDNHVPKARNRTGDTAMHNSTPHPPTPMPVLCTLVPLRR